MAQKMATQSAEQEKAQTAPVLGTKKAVKAPKTAATKKATVKTKPELYTPASPLFIGIDEAGRGCLAGPVVAAAVILPPETDSSLSRNAHTALQGLTDSKKLSEKQRLHLEPLIKEHALAWGLGVVWPKAIDRINILQATFVAMARACATLHTSPYAICLQNGSVGARAFSSAPLAPLLCIDGNKIVPLSVLLQYAPAYAHETFSAETAAQFLGNDPPLSGSTFGSALTHYLSADALEQCRHGVAQEYIIGGDAKVAAISAASVLAKTFRDRLMQSLHARYPAYGFVVHKGYGTAAHIAAIAAHGASPMHRLSFAKVKPETTSAPKQATLW